MGMGSCGQPRIGPRGESVRLGDRIGKQGKQRDGERRLLA